MARKKSTAAPTKTPIPKEERWQLTHDFLRTYLHLTVYAEMGRAKTKEKSNDDAKWEVWRAGRELAEAPDNQLAGLLASPVMAVAGMIKDLLWKTEAALRSKTLSDEQTNLVNKLSDQLDFSLALMHRDLGYLISSRGEHTNNPDLFAEAMNQAKGDGNQAAQLIRRCRDCFPDEIGTYSENIVDMFAWETYQRVEALDKLADEFPEQISFAAANMHGWPMIRQRHHDNHVRFEELAARLNLGTNYPLDASKSARFRPDTPMVRYLDPLVCRVNYVRELTLNKEYESLEAEHKALRGWWRDTSGDMPDEATLKVLQIARKLPPLLKSTARVWASQALVPLILVTDAKDHRKCDHAALRQVASQRGVKSRAIFKSRLLATIIPTLTGMARAG